MEPGDNDGNINRNYENDNSSSMTFSANLTIQKPRMTNEIESNLFDNNSRSSVHDFENNNGCEGILLFNLSQLAGNKKTLQTNVKFELHILSFYYRVR